MGWAGVEGAFWELPQHICLNCLMMGSQNFPFCKAQQCQNVKNCVGSDGEYSIINHWFGKRGIFFERMWPATYKNWYAINVLLTMIQKGRDDYTKNASRDSYGNCPRLPLSLYEIESLLNNRKRMIEKDGVPAPGIDDQYLIVAASSSS